MRRATQLLGLILILAAPLRAQGQDREGLWIDQSTPDTLVALPGEVVTVVYAVVNDTGADAVFHPEYILPIGWSSLTPAADIALSAGERTVAFLSVRSSSSMVAGKYGLRVLVSNEDHAAEFVSWVRIGTTDRLAMALQPELAFVQEGTSHEMSVQITNRGNQVSTVALQATSNPPVDLMLSEESVILEAGAATVVSLRMMPQAVGAENTSVVIYVSARSIDSDRGFASASADVRIIPLWDEVSNARTTVPVRLTVQSVGDEKGALGQVGLVGRIPVADGVVDLDILATQSRRSTLFGTRDRYGVSYRSTSLDLDVLDFTRSLSPLTGGGLSGSGAGVRYRFGRFAVSGLGQVTRHAFPRQTVGGASVEYQLSKSSVAGLNVVSRAGLYEGTLMSLRYRFAPMGNSTLFDIECGIDSGSGTVPSCMAALAGRTSRLGYQARVHKTSESFPGANADGHEAAARVTYKVSEPLSLDGDARTYAYRLSEGYRRDRDQQRLGAALVGRLGNARVFSKVYVARESQSYRGQIFSSERTEESVRVQAGLQTRPIGIDGTLDLGSARSATDDYSGSLMRSRVTVRSRPTPQLSVWLAGERGTGYLINSSSPMERWLLSGQASLRLGRLGLGATVYHNRFESVTSYASTSFRTRVSHTLRTGQELRVEAQQTHIGGDRSDAATDYRLSFSQPVGVPVGKRPEMPDLLSGRIYDAETGIGLGGALLFLDGAAALSNGEGVFNIPAPAAEVGYLRLDQGSIGFDRVSMLEMPMEVTAASAIGATLEIPVVAAASLAGSFELFGSRNGDWMVGDTDSELERRSGVSGIVLELRSMDFRYRARTGADGGFSFRNVVPGRYELVLLSRLPERYRLASDEMDFHLRPGETQSRSYRVEPVRPALKMLQIADESAVSAREPEPVEPPESFNVDWEVATKLRRYVVVIGSTPDEAEARAIQRRHRELELPSTIRAYQIGGATRYRVLVGQYPNAAAADLTRTVLKDLIPTGSWVLRLRSLPEASQD